MPTKWYQKATVQGAFVAAAGLIIVTSVPVALQVPKLQDENRSLERMIGQKDAETQRLEAQLAPFRTIALERYTGPENEALAKLAGQIELLQRLDEEKNAKIKALQDSLDKTSQQASPPKLTLESCTVNDVDGNKVAALRFIPSKNVPLGIVTFSAEVSRLSLNQPAKIVDFWPDARTGAFQSGENSKKIASDGYSAQLTYQPVGAGALSIQLTVTSSATVIVSGNYIDKAIVVTIE